MQEYISVIENCEQNGIEVTLGVRYLIPDFAVTSDQRILTGVSCSQQCDLAFCGECDLINKYSSPSPR